MITYNVLGDCVSRDILNPLIDAGEARVLQFAGFSNLISMFSEKAEREIRMEDLQDINGSNFSKRTMTFDYNKTTLDYIFQKKSDYLVLNIIDSRAKMLKKGGHCVTLVNLIRKNREKFDQKLGLDTYEELSPYGIEETRWNQVVDKLCQQLLKHYTPGQIIIPKHYGVSEYEAGGRLGLFSQQVQDTSKQCNALILKLEKRLLANLQGCHCIEFPQNVLALKGHRFGLCYLHYTDDYYGYGAQALRIIAQRLPAAEEQNKLTQLTASFEARSKILRENLRLHTELQKTQTMLQWTKNALNFSRKINLDHFGDNVFLAWLHQLKASGNSVAILKAQDLAGRILISALQKHEIEIAFTVEKIGDLASLTEEDFLKCRQAGVIVCADVHSNRPLERDGVTAIRITDIFKQETM